MRTLEDNSYAAGALGALSPEHQQPGGTTTPISLAAAADGP